MISLVLKAFTQDQDEPFVVRLSTGKVEILEDDARLVGVDGETLVFDSRYGPLKIVGLDPDHCHHDILYVDPERQRAHRWIRADSVHNTLLITERCDQLCLMCSQPPKKYHHDLFFHFRKAIFLAPQQAMIGLSGGEPLLFKEQVIDLIRASLRDRPDLSFNVLTNGQHFDESDITALQAIPKGQVLWGIPLYASDSETHDEIVQKEGAFEMLLRVFPLLARAGSSIELRTVVMKPNVESLPRLASFIQSKLPFIDVWAIMQLENIGYGRMNWKSLFWDHSINFSHLAEALDMAKARGIEARLYNFPLCTVPDSFRDRAPRTISDWKLRYLSECNNCAARKTCTGFFEWYPEESGFAEVRAL